MFKLAPLAFAAGALLAPAQEGPRPPRPPAAGFSALDLDRDGTVSAQEIAAAAASLRKLDKNNDGQITEDELRPTRPPRPEGERPEGPANGQRPAEVVDVLMAFDKNHDGKLSKDELPERMQPMFARADANNDGFLTPDELKVYAAATAARNAPPPEPPRPGIIRLDPIFAAIDTNHDGVLSSEEIDNAPKSLQALDKNNDGQITADEARPNFPQREGRPRQ